MGGLFGNRWVDRISRRREKGGSMKLYLVTLQGLSGIVGRSYKNCYVCAHDPSEAYLIIRTWLDKKDYGFRKDRALDSIKWIADEDEFSECSVPLFLVS